MLLPTRTERPTRAFLPKDWLFRPLLGNISSTIRDSHRSLKVQGVIRLLSYVSFLSVTSPAAFGVVSSTDRLRGLIQVLRLGHDVYADSGVQHLLEVLWLGIVTDPLPVTEISDLEGTKMLSSYQNLIEEYVTASYSNRVLARYSVVLLQQHFAYDFRFFG